MTPSAAARGISASETGTTATAELLGAFLNKVYRSEPRDEIAKVMANAIWLAP